MSIDYALLFESDLELEQVRSRLETKSLGRSCEGMFLSIRAVDEHVVLKLPVGEIAFVGNVLLRVEINGFYLTENIDVFLRNLLAVWSMNSGSIVLFNSLYSERPLLAKTGNSVWLSPLYESHLGELERKLSEAGIRFSVGSIERDFDSPSEW